MTRSTVIILTAVISSLVALQARADTRVTVHDFHGTGANRLRADVVTLLEREPAVTLISLGQIESSAKRLGVDAFTPEGRLALSRELQVSAWMTGVIKRRSGTLTLTVEVYDGAQHSLVGRTSLSGRNAAKLSGEIRKHLWRRSQSAILQASAPKSSTPKPSSGAKVASLDETRDEDLLLTRRELPAPTARTAIDDELPPALQPRPQVDSDEAAEASDADDEPREDKLLRASLGFGSPYRSLAYNDPVTTSLGNYQLSGSPMADFHATFHPGRLFTDGLLSWIGLEVQARIAASSQTADGRGNKYDSEYTAYHLGVRGRIPLGDHYVSAFGGYAASRFSIDPVDENIVAPSPGVDYRMIRPGVGAEIALSDSLMIGADFAWLLLFSVGDLGTWFPRSTAGGFELAGFATYNFTPNLFMRADATYQQAFFDFNSKPGDSNIAGGATDQYLAMSVGAGVSL